MRKSIDVDQDLNNFAPRARRHVDADRRRADGRARRVRYLLRSGLQQHLGQHQQLGPVEQRHRAESRVSRSVCRRHGGRDQAKRDHCRAGDRRRRRRARSAPACGGNWRRASRSASTAFERSATTCSTPSTSMPRCRARDAAQPGLPAHRAVPDDRTKLDQLAARVARAPYRPRAALQRVVHAFGAERDVEDFGFVPQDSYNPTRRRRARQQRPAPSARHVGRLGAALRAAGGRACSRPAAACRGT